MSSEILTWAEKAVKLAEALGAEQAEAFVMRDDLKYLTVELGEVKFRSRDSHTGMGLTVNRNGSLGFAYTTKMDDGGVEDATRDSLKVASVRVPDPNFKGFPEPKKIIPVTGAYDEKLAQLSDIKAVELATTMMEASKQPDSAIIPTFGVLECHKRTKAVVNSMGLAVEDVGTILSVGLRTLLKKGDRAGNGYDFQSSRNLDKIDPAAIGYKAGELAVSSMDTRDIETCKTTVILDPHAVAGVFGSVLAQPLMGNLIHEKRSIFVDKVGHDLGCEKITVIDDGTLPGGHNTGSFDAEGVPMQRKTLIDKGVLKGYVYDTYTSNLANTESTGNAVRSGGYMTGNRPYRNTPTVGATNFIIATGDSNRETMIEETDDGVLLTFAVGGGSPISGDFSTDARNAFKIEGGEIAYPIKQAMFTGNVLDILKNLESISKKSRFSGGLSPGMVLAPTIKFSQGTIIGGK